MLTPDEIDEIAWQALIEVTNKYAKECTKIISKPQAWEGFNDTRDIVDTGQLRASQKIDYSRSTLTTEVSYNTEYAAAVHNGATIKYTNGNTRVIPARPWMTDAEKSVKVSELLSKRILKELKKHSR